MHFKIAARIRVKYMKGALSLMGKLALFNMAITLDIGEQPSWSAVAMPDEER